MSGPLHGEQHFCCVSAVYYRIPGYPRQLEYIKNQRLSFDKERSKDLSFLRVNSCLRENTCGRLISSASVRFGYSEYLNAGKLCNLSDLI